VALALDYRYVKVSAGAGKIGSCDEVTTTTFGTTITTARKLVFKAEQPTKTVGTTTAQIQVKQAEWTIAHGTAPATTSSGDTTNPLQLTINDVVAGDTYTATFKYKSYWGDFGTVDTRSYTVGAGVPGGPGGALTVTCNFSTSASLGINQFAVPFTTTPTTPIQFQGPVGTPVSINNMQQLVDAINRPVVEGGAGAGTVKTAGWWNKTAQVMVGWTGIDGTVAAQNGAPATLAGEVFGAATMDKVYQMSVARPVSFTLTGTR
jgi:hypothetical protein